MVHRRPCTSKKPATDLLRILGGREIHPVNVKVGLLTASLTRKEFAPVTEELKTASDLAKNS